MQKSGGVQILMQIDLNKLRIKYIKVAHIDELKQLSVLQPFDKRVCEFFNQLSSALRKDIRAKKFPDIITFAFFIRKANLEKLKNLYQTTNRIGKGLSFHIAPSNVPINFAYTFAAGLLAGNACIVRASSKEFEQTDIICDVMNRVAEGNNNPIIKYLVIMTYDREKEITDKLSCLCDIRIIWGGDNTVKEIRKSSLPARSTEITFSDRYSICVIDAAYFLTLTDMKSVAQAFYNDTYLYDQNACSSPRLLYWLGDEQTIKCAKEKFWLTIHEYIESRYKIEPVIAMDKLTMAYRAAIGLEGVVLQPEIDNLINRISIKELTEEVMDYVCPGGSFIEYGSTCIDDLENIVNKKFQTLSYLGCDAEKLGKWVIDRGFSGIDRIVPIGKAADFTLIWDGYNLIEEMSRQVYWE